MIIGQVMGSVIATRKHEKLTGSKFLVVMPLDTDNPACLVAVDRIGAGAGERVLVARGGAARLACGAADMPVDAAVVGIIDEGSYTMNAEPKTRSQPAEPCASAN